MHSHILTMILVNNNTKSVLLARNESTLSTKGGGEKQTIIFTINFVAFKKVSHFLFTPTGADMTIDDRSYVMQAVATMPLYTSVIYFYPRLLPLHDIDPQGADLPQQLRCSFDKFLDDGAYLLGTFITSESTFFPLCAIPKYGWL